MEGIGNMKLQLFGEFWNMKSSVLTEVKSLKNEFFQPCVKHSPSEQVNVNSTNEILERFIKQLE